MLPTKTKEKAWFRITHVFPSTEPKFYASAASDAATAIVTG